MNDVMQGRWTLLHVIRLVVWQKHVKIHGLWMYGVTVFRIVYTPLAVTTCGGHQLRNQDFAWDSGSCFAGSVHLDQLPLELAG